MSLHICDGEMKRMLLGFCSLAQVLQSYLDEDLYVKVRKINQIAQNCDELLKRCE